MVITRLFEQLVKNFPQYDPLISEVLVTLFKMKISDKSKEQRFAVFMTALSSSNANVMR